MAKRAAAAWRVQYPYILMKNCTEEQEDKREIYYQLVDLGKNPDPEEVSDIIGNRSWTVCVCDECGQETKVVVSIAAGGAAGSRICVECLQRAIRTAKELLKKEQRGNEAAGSHK